MTDYTETLDAIDEWRNKVFWTLPDAVQVIKQIESFAPLCSCHVGLTGVVLYKEGERKDLDLLFYRVRQDNNINTARLEVLLAQMKIHVTAKYGWVWKARYHNRGIDFLFPEFPAHHSDNYKRNA